MSRCVLCGAVLDEQTRPLVATSDGQQVHIACADQMALAAWQQRQRAALLHGGVALGVCAAVAWLAAMRC